MLRLIYGSGLRVSECSRLRVKDLDLEQGLVTVRASNGDKDRTTRGSAEIRSWNLESRKRILE